MALTTGTPGSTAIAPGSTTNLPVVIQANIESGFAGGVEISLLGYDINGIVEKDTAGTRILVMKKGGKRQSQTVEKIIERLNSTFNTSINTADVDNVLSYIGLSAEETTINLNQAFLLYDSSLAANNTEYAFSLSVNNEPKTPEDGQGLNTGGIFAIKSVSFSVWNTSRSSVLSKMGIGTIKQLLDLIETEA